VESDATLPGVRGLYIARVMCFFSFKDFGLQYKCALVQWFTTVGDSPCGGYRYVDCGA
jgi:hypothetical protein